MAKLTLDIVCEIIKTPKLDLLFDDGRKFSELSNLNIRVVNEEGPGGGWPEIELEGSVEDITAYLRNDYCYDEEDVEMTLEYLEE